MMATCVELHNFEGHYVLRIRWLLEMGLATIDVQSSNLWILHGLLGSYSLILQLFNLCTSSMVLMM